MSSDQPTPQHKHEHEDEIEQENYYCHQCILKISIPIPPPSSSAKLTCPRCHGEFLEPVNLPSPPSLPPLHHLSPSPFSSTPLNHVDLSTVPDSAAAASVFDPFTFLQNYLRSIWSGGANVQHGIQNSVEDGSPPGLRMPAANLPDYTFGPGLEQLIQLLAENDPNR